MCQANAVGSACLCYCSAQYIQYFDTARDSAFDEHLARSRIRIDRYLLPALYARYGYRSDRYPIGAAEGVSLAGRWQIYIYTVFLVACRRVQVCIRSYAGRYLVEQGIAGAGTAH